MSRQLGKSRVPFFGTPEDAAILADVKVDEMALVGSMGDGTTELQAQELSPGAVKEIHPDAVEKGTSIPLGFHQHQGENRATRRKNGATWAPPVDPPGRETQNEAVESAKPRMPTRRELLEQRQKHQRGKLDPELRRLQKRKAESK